MRSSACLGFGVALLAALVAIAPAASSGTDPIVRTSWTPYAGNPVLTAGPAGTWDDQQVVGGPVLLVNDTYRMWYVGSGNNNNWSTGTATSTDGIHWTKYAGNPVIVGDGGPQVLYENGKYEMWYTYASPNAYTVPWQVRYATSADGIRWTQVVNDSLLNVTAGAWDSNTLQAGPVLHDASGYRMWYGATADEMVWRVGLATSPDGFHWTKYGGNPIIVPPFAGAWDNFRVHPSSIFWFDGELVMWYVSDDTNLVQRIGVATSLDGIHWTPRPTPVLDVGPSGTWDARSLSRLSVVRQGSQFQTWYTGINASTSVGGQWAIGYATATLEPTPSSALSAMPDALGFLEAAVMTLGGAGAGVAVFVAAVRSIRQS